MAKWRKLPKKKKVKVKVEIIRTWSGRGWHAEIIENEDGGGWAVTMTREGDDEPAYVGPWTMGRNKIDPKPLSAPAFNTWVKSATEFLARSQRQIRNANRRQFDVETPGGDAVRVTFELLADEYEAEGLLLAEDIFGNELARISVPPSYTLTSARAWAWTASDFGPPDDPTDMTDMTDMEVPAADMEVPAADMEVPAAESGESKESDEMGEMGAW